MGKVLFMCRIVRRNLVTAWSMMGLPVGQEIGRQVEFCEQHRCIVERAYACPRKPDITPDLREEILAMRELAK
jgi:hypothetical protein